MRLSFARPLCNDPFYKPLHPPGLRPSPFLSDLRRMEGGYSYSAHGSSDIVNVKRTPSDGLCPPAPPVGPALCFGRQGERCISNERSRYKRKIRVYRFELSRVGPCVRPQSSYISVDWSLLSKGLRGGKSRRRRVESLLRHMLQSARSK